VRALIVAAHLPVAGPGRLESAEVVVEPASPALHEPHYAPALAGRRSAGRAAHFAAWLQAGEPVVQWGPAAVVAAVPLAGMEAAEAEVELASSAAGPGEGECRICAA